MESLEPLLPSVDLGPFMVDEGVVVGEAPTVAQSTAAAAIHAISTNHGFMHITNWGMTKELKDEAFAAAEELFALPEAEKMEQLNRITPQTNIGYAPYGLEMLNRSRPPDLKECFNVRFEPAHKNDFRGCPQRFETVARKVQEVIAHAAKRYALAAALALGLETDFFFAHARPHGPTACSEVADRKPQCDSRGFATSRTSRALVKVVV